MSENLYAFWTVSASLEILVSGFGRVGGTTGVYVVPSSGVFRRVTVTHRLFVSKEVGYEDWLTKMLDWM